MIEQIAKTPESACVTPEACMCVPVCVCDRQPGGREKWKERKPLSNMNLHFSSASLLSVFHSNEYPTDKTIRLRDKTLVPKALLMLGRNTFSTVSLHISYRQSL